MRHRTPLDDGLVLLAFGLSLGVAALITPANAGPTVSIEYVKGPAPQKVAQSQPAQPPAEQAPAQPGDQTPAVTPPQTPSDLGLVRTTDTRLQIVYSLPDTNWSRFRTIQLHTLEVPPDAADATPRNARTRGRESFVLGDREISALQDAFAQAIRSTLTSAGYTFVDTPQADTLIVAPRVADIVLSAPVDSSRRAGRTRTYTQGGGSISISAVFADGGTGQVVGMATARNRPSNIWRINNRVTNMADARTAFNEWARMLRDQLRSQGSYGGQ